MIKNSKFVKTAIAAAALGLVTLSLQAATLATNSTTFATQVFAGTTPSAAVTTAVINVNTAANLNAGSSVTVMVQLTGGKYATALGALGIPWSRARMREKESYAQPVGSHPIDRLFQDLRQWQLIIR